MGDKHASRGASTPTTYKLKIVIFFSLVLVLLMWNSAPFGSRSESTVTSGPADADIAVGDAESYGSYIVRHDEDSLNDQDGGLRPSQDVDEPKEGDNNGAEEISRHHTEDERRETLEPSDDEPELEDEGDNNGAEEISTRSHEEEHRETLEPIDDEPQLEDEGDNNGAEEVSTGRPETLEPSDDEPQLEEDGNLRSKGNVKERQFFEQIRAESLPYSTIRTGERNTSCEGKYIYVYDLPPEFNVNLVAGCKTLFPKFNLCDYIADSGMGYPVDTFENGTQVFVPADQWFNTHQYALELISHARIKRYKCLTQNPGLASLFYIPFYAGLDVIRWNLRSDSTGEQKDALSLKLLQWLETQPSWKRRGGRDHVFVLGKITWDFRRSEDHGTWGNRLLQFPETQNVVKVLIERNAWEKNDIGVPHPTFFHPRSGADITTWLNRIRSQPRTSLVTFVGKERPGTTNVRTQLVRQCRNVTTPEDCRFVECNHNLCQFPAYVTKAFLTTDFCMQPVGDSPTRRSVFDSLIAGCIPVLFHPRTAYVQYPWHLPANESSWSVYISEDEVKRGEVNVIEVLQKIPVAEIEAMRRTIIDTIVPGLLYGAPGGDFSPYKDAFEITIEQLLHRVAMNINDRTDAN